MPSTARPSTSRACAALAVVAIAFAVLVGGADRADAATAPGSESVVVAADPVGIDVDGRWFALFAVAFLLLPARRGKGASGPASKQSKPSKRSSEDAEPADGDGGSTSPTSAPLALPTASLDDLDAEVATEILQFWAERPAR